MAERHRLRPKKLGGILIDLRGEAAGPAYVVVGVGINVRLPQAPARKRSAPRASPPPTSRKSDRCRVAFACSALVNELALALEEFGARGMADADEWQGADALANRPVRVLQGEQTLEGLARGVDADGALLLDAGGGRRRILSGEVRVSPHCGDV